MGWKRQKVLTNARMKLSTLIFSGIAGTFLMTTFLYLISTLFQVPYKVVMILGTMLTGETGPQGEQSSSRRAITVGLCAHYAVGIFFAITYGYGVWHEVFYLSLKSALLFSAVAGVVGVGVWQLFFKIHPHPPALPLAGYLVSIYVGHLVFGLGMFAVIQMEMLFPQ